MAWSHLSNNAKGIICAILSAFFGALLVILVRYLAQDFHVFFIVMVRNFLALLLLVPNIFYHRHNIFKTNRPRLHLFRGFNGLVSMYLWFYIVTIIPLSEAVSISFVVPILSSVVAVFYLKEVVRREIFLACILGFIGVLVILRPGFKEFNNAYFFSFASLILWTISNVTIKVMTRTEKTQTIVVYMTIIMLVASIPLGLFYLEPLSLRDVLLLLALGLTSNLLHFSISNAYKLVDLSYVQPFDFMRLLFTAVLAYFVFGEIIDFWVIT
ncbi:MAG: DMT family transporter, partial [Rickettsiales bacterium]|nr:DMT family transporter [Rickettsiales bacterium]